MVRILNLDASDDGLLGKDPDQDRGGDAREAFASIGDDDRPNPNVTLPFAAALSCYPIISQIASHLDLNSLHDLSQTCRQFRVNLLQFRDRLMAQSLRCHNEKSNPARRLGSALNASYAQWTAPAHRHDQASRLAGGKVGSCARDLVGPCQRCSTIVCRNCIVKQPSSTAMKDRLRRLCRVCMKSSLDRLVVVTRPIPTTGEDDDDADDDADDDDNVGTRPKLARLHRHPCLCETTFWICQPCGHSLRSDDTSYSRAWAWRTKLSNCGGIGAGLGEGNQGVECGRGSDCLDAKHVEHEIECDPHHLAALEADETAKASIRGRHWAGSSYLAHEIVGIGGKVKTKIKKSRPVAAPVPEYEDERGSPSSSSSSSSSSANCAGHACYLRRERDGSNRSWCSWCHRVVPGRSDLEALGVGSSSESVASHSSGSSR